MIFEKNRRASMSTLRSPNSRSVIISKRSIPETNQPYIVESQVRINDEDGTEQIRRVQQLVHKNKINMLTKIFAKKLMTNSIHRQPLDQNLNLGVGTQNTDQNKLKLFFHDICQMKGISINQFMHFFWKLLSLVQIGIMVIVFSLIIAFPQIKNHPQIIYLRVASLILCLFDIILNFITKRYQGNYLSKISDISRYYLRNGFVVDLLTLIVFPWDILFNLHQVVEIFMLLLALWKLSVCINKFERIQNLYVNTQKREKYYGLVKVLAINFAIGHLLSIVLNLMAQLNTESNWLGNLSSQLWYIRYVWGYYFGTTMMLTIGFGDFSATNHDEALVLIFVMIFSCIILAYNINVVGSLITSLKQSEVNRIKKIKTFHKMCRQNNVKKLTEQRIRYYMQQQDKINMEHQFQLHDQIITSIPNTLQKLYLRQANRGLFSKLNIMQNLPTKTILNIAQNITRRIGHSQQILFYKGSEPQLLIIKKGTLGLTCNNGSKLDGVIIQTFQSDQKNARILNYGFIKRKPLSYDIKSIGYSILYHISQQDLMETIKRDYMSYQVFCMYRDKDIEKLGGQNSHLCLVCKDDYHTKFECSKLHYIPLKSHIFLKYANKLNSKQKRHQKFYRSRIKEKGCLKQKYNVQIGQKKYIEHQILDKKIKQILQGNVKHNKEKQIINSVFQQFFQNQIILEDPDRQQFIEQTDMAYNFPHYFRANNPDRLIKTNKHGKQSAKYQEVKKKNIYKFNLFQS